MITVPQCKALVIACSDYRFRNVKHGFLGTQFHAYDLLMIPGGAHALTPHRDKDTDTDFFLRQIGIFLNGCRPASRTIAIMHHENCAKYGTCACFEPYKGNREREEAFHAEEMQSAAKTIEAAFPKEIGTRRIETYFANLDGEIKRIEFHANRVALFPKANGFKPKIVYTNNKKRTAR